MSTARSNHADPLPDDEPSFDALRNQGNRRARRPRGEQQAATSGSAPEPVVSSPESHALVQDSGSASGELRSAAPLAPVPAVAQTLPPAVPPAAAPDAPPPVATAPVVAATASVAAAVPPTTVTVPAAPAAEAAVSYDQSRFAPTTVMVGPQVGQRFEYYQDKQRRETGAEPSNTAVLLQALNFCYGRYAQLIGVRRQPAETSALPFPGHAPSRRATAGRRSTEQLAIRPTEAELAQIDALSRGAGARNRSEFADVVLEAFLQHEVPVVPKTFKRKRG
jgi:hypothetical protein